MSGFDTSRLLRDEKELFGTDLHYRRFLALFLAGTVIVISYISLFGKWGDLNYYFQCMDTLLDGNIPYKDYEYEFPPLSIPFLLLPRLLSLNVDMYHFWYAFFAFVQMMVSLRYSLRIADLLNIHRRWIYLLTMLILISGNKFIFARFDVFTTMFVIMSAYCYLKKDYGKAFVLMGVAAMIKIYPQVFLVPMIVPFLVRKDFRAVARGILLPVVVFFAAEQVFLIADPGTAFQYVNYHGDRGIQIESTVASILEVFNLFIPGFVEVDHSYGSHNLVGPVADAVLPFVIPIMAGALGMFLLAMLYLMYKGRGNDGVWAAVPLCMLVLAFIFVGLNKVYSAQYHLWMITIFFVLLAVPLSRRELRISMALIVGMCVFATINSFTYSSILDPSFVIVIFIRNIFHLQLIGYLGYICIRHLRGRGPQMPAIPVSDGDSIERIWKKDPPSARGRR